MSTLKLSVLVFAFATFAFGALAQPVPNAGAATSPGATMMRISATQPVTLAAKNGAPGRFRVMFRLLGVADQEVPIYAIGIHSGVFEWLAFTASGTRCAVEQADFKGVGVVRSNYLEGAMKALNEKSTSQWNVNKSRPTIAIADFECDGRVAPGDAATVQVKFYLYNGATWVTADYTFENLKIGAGS